MKARLALIATTLAAIGGCGGGATPLTGEVTAVSRAQQAVSALVLSADRVEIGRQIFNDPSLSASGAMSCATCHVASRAHADAPGGFLPLGGPGMDQQGLRSSPTTHYLFANSAFRFENNLPVGGFTWDGRADTLIDQAAGPFFESVEMANTDLPDLMSKVRRAGWFNAFLTTFGLARDASNEVLFEGIKQALATYELGDGDYRLFNSKFDRSLDGQTALSEQELRGHALFNDPAKGNCTACHTGSNQADGGKPLFTNFAYYALGVPRNASIRNQDPNFFDLGLCGPNRKDLAGRADLCGKFKTPTLRNVELTAPYFHNAAINDLADAVRFHVTRDTDPARWYPAAGGVPAKYNDLPVQYQGNLVRTAPFDRQSGQAPALSEAEIADVVAFLKTLTDVIPVQ